MIVLILTSTIVGRVSRVTTLIPIVGAVVVMTLRITSTRSDLVVVTAVVAMAVAVVVVCGLLLYKKSLNVLRHPALLIFSR